ncbi:MAG: bacteriorhodopsin-like, partial [Paracoccaceae bacterium]|nr:bacteriorhodopsin-like [Paracoccaceae bacterium]
FLLVRSTVAPRHRMAVTISTVVVAIAAYHYLRIFDSWGAAFAFTNGEYIQVAPFNEGYRYVDWLITVPLLLAELVIVLKLNKSTTRSLLVRLSRVADQRMKKAHAVDMCGLV